MATTTLATLRQYVSEELGDWLKCTTTTLITTDAYVKSTELASYPDGKFNDNYYILITSGSNSGTKRVVKGFIQSNSRVEVYGANLAAEIIAVTFELHRHDPATTTTAVNRAIQESFPLLCVRTADPDGGIDSEAFISSVSVDTDTVPLDEATARALGCFAASKLLESQIMPIGSQEVSRFAGEADRLRTKGNNLLLANAICSFRTTGRDSWLTDLTSEG